ncbi:MAG: exodeoxyribonuclease VII large subunit [Candidatus Promineifilaceae bacterium]
MGAWLEARYGEEPVWDVSGLTAYIRELFESDIGLQAVMVRGEISNFTRARSGHLYFTLKDAHAQLKCVMWRSFADRLRYSCQEGDAVLVRGRIGVYEAGGAYQLYADWLQPAGRGDLAAALEELRARLAAEGLFDLAHKRPLPTVPGRIGVVTSADGAALRDLLNVLGRRWPLVSVLVAPTLVQGLEAPAQIVRALAWLDGRDDVDLIILARGGGSLEDLWAFNDERVARAIFACRRPVISGVGHETDLTIADLVADLRAPTPSAAAEMATPDRGDALAALAGLKEALTAGIGALLARWREQLQGLDRELGHLSPRSRLDSGRQRLDWLAGRLDAAGLLRLERVRGRLLLAQAGLQAVSPQATLARGYAIVRARDGQLVRSVGQVTPGMALDVTLGDGHFGVTVE